MRVTAYIGIGANLGDAHATVRQALRQLGGLRKTRLTGSSSLFRTAPLGADGDDYVNAVARVDTELSALELLHELHALEQAAGRTRPYANAPRTLDLDLLLYGRQQIDSESLVVPHPRMTQRAFVLIPLLQIDPMIAIPGKGPAHRFVPDVAGQAIQRLPD
ncbi:MAG TPA: 2-amino-4-hydroxy-6-hydroxymethyldihydropteridine diphosphokinase [Burkholderiaceae bacterium]|nr:2-amino-4-hydroxy-6-hydroxymethyldihydropteridine diphosphokinase [Burkholderiaceae bacterium]